MRKKKILLAVGLLSVALIGLSLGLSDQAMTATEAPSAFRFSAPSGWQESESYLGMRTWTGDSARKQFVSVIEDDSIQAKIPPPDDRKLIEIVRQASAFPNWIARIKDWKVDRVEREALAGGGFRIALIGTYHNAKNELIQFEEWKYFLSDRYGQINFSELAGPQARTRAQVAEILKRYRPFGT